MRNHAVAVAAPAAAEETWQGYWSGGILVVLAMCGLVALRLHELVPGIGVIKPVFSLSIGGMIVLVSRSPRALRKNIAERPLSKMVLWYYGMILLSMPFAMWRGGAFEIVRLMFPAILLFISFQFLPPSRKMLDRLQFGFVALVLFFAAYQQFFGRMWGGRLVGMTGSLDSNDMASVLAMGLPLSIGLVSRMSERRQVIGGVLAILALVLGVIATGSRGGTLALVAGAVVYVLGLRGEKRFIVLIAMVIAGGLFWVTAPPSFRQRIDSLTHLEDDYNTTLPAGRKAVWARARMYIRQHPVFGVGAGNFIVAEGGHNQATGNTGKWSNAHNAYLQALAELGIPGGSVFIGMLLTAAWAGVLLLRPRAPPGLEPLARPEYLAALAAYAMGAYFLSHAYFSALYSILGIISLADRVRIAEAHGVVAAVPTRGKAPAAPIRLSGQRGGLSWTGSRTGGGKALAPGRMSRNAMRGALAPGRRRGTA